MEWEDELADVSEEARNWLDKLGSFSPTVRAEAHDDIQAANGAAGPPVMRNMDCAPLDGTLVQLLVRFDHNGIEDTNEPAWTIGSHNDGEWNFVGWCWHTDQWARGSGDLLAWLPVGPNVGNNRL